MSDYGNFDYSGRAASPEYGGMPRINLDEGVKAEPALPVNASELLSRLFDIKKQLSQSFQYGGSVGGVSKPQSRRNSFLHKDDDDDDDRGNERKRRDNVNERIQELLTLIPPEYFLEQPRDEDGPGTKSTGTKDGKPNKGQILSKAVEYIQAMQNLIDENNRKEVQLLLKLKTLQMRQQGKANVPVSVGTTSAELALGQIGVGPHADEYFRQVLIDAGKR